MNLSDAVLQRPIRLGPGTACSPRPFHERRLLSDIRHDRAARRMTEQHNEETKNYDERRLCPTSPVELPLIAGGAPRFVGRKGKRGAFSFVGVTPFLPEGFQGGRNELKL